MNKAMVLDDGTVLLREADGTPVTIRVSEVITDAEAMYAVGDVSMARAVLMSLGVWLDHLMLRVEMALDKIEDRHDN